MPTREKNDCYKVQVLDRAVAVLEALAGQGSEMSLVDLTKALKLHKSTTHRLVMALESYALIDKDPHTGRYRLGMKLFELGSKAVANLNIRDRARPNLDRLAFETGETVHLCIVDNGEMLYIDKVEPARSVRLASSVGRRIAMHCSAVGKAVLAVTEDDRVYEIVRKHGMAAHTQHTLTTPAALVRELHEVRAKGYAMDNEENEEGVRCIGAAIFDYTGHAIGAVSISGPTFRLSEQQVATLAPAVVRAANEISQELGASPARFATAVAAR